MVNNLGIETVEASIVLKGMEVRMMEVLDARIVDIQKATETAVKKAINEFDFDAAIADIINAWLEDKIRDMSINVLDNEMYNITPELSRVVLATVKKTLDEATRMNCTEQIVECKHGDD